MASETKQQIMEAALELFAQNGYLGTSMSDIASCLGITKGALYKHYKSKREILEKILERMAELDFERAQEYGMPENNDGNFAEEYNLLPVEKIREYSIAQFRHWTEEKFSSQFRRMLTVEQHRNVEMSELFQNYLASGPLEYMASIFRKNSSSDEDAMQIALEFYGPMFFLYSVYDGAEPDKKDSVVELLKKHIDRFIERFEAKRINLSEEK